MRTIIFLLLIGLSLLAGCAPATMENLDASKRVRVFEAGRDAVFQAMLDAFADEEIPVVNTDRSRGTIVTGFKENGMISKALMGNIRAKFNVTLNAESAGRTQALALIVMEKQLEWPLSGWRAVESDEAELEQWYNDFFDAVEEKLGRK